MQLQILKVMVEKSSLSPERLTRATQIIDEALTGGALSSEQRDELVTLIQTESTEQRDMADALQEVADSVDTLISAASL